MGTYILKRLLLAIPTLLIASIIIFSLIHIAPGGPVRILLGPMQDPALVEEMRSHFGLDEPIYRQYLSWIGNALHGDLGTSVTVHRGASVTNLLLQRYRVTLELAILSVIVALTIAIPAGIISALRQNKPADHLSRIVALIGVSIPNFFLGMILIIIFGVLWLRPWGSGGYVPLTSSVSGNLLRMILPAIALGTSFSAIVMRMMRSAMLDVMSQDYIRTAKAMGVKWSNMLRRDVIKNALIPVVTVIGNSAGYLLGGSIVTETIFRLPGVGRLVISGVFRRDFPVIQGVVLTIVVIRILINLSVDISYAFLDPRIRFGSSKQK
ncbi:ABC transporter permease [Candidatus Bipolaricaulota bacterium]|nr:ABC transporter permease [Candidatus Bipolaricaulota bacterium]